MDEWTSTLRCCCWKTRHNTSDAAYNSLRTELESSISIRSLRSTRRYLESLFGLKVQEYHQCVNNCMVFTGNNYLEIKCHFCREPRFIGDRPLDSSQPYLCRAPSAVYSYLPLIPWLKLMYANRDYARKMLYPLTLIEDLWAAGIRDIWKGEVMKC